MSEESAEARFKLYRDLIRGADALYRNDPSERGRDRLDAILRVHLEQALRIFLAKQSQLPKKKRVKFSAYLRTLSRAFAKTESPKGRRGKS